MSNSIAAVIQNLPKVIDKVNKEASLSVDLNIGDANIKAGLDNSSEVRIRKYAFGGLGKYDGTITSNAGVTATWETQKLQNKRSTKLYLEKIEGLEGQVELAEMVSEFQRVEVVPERDAYVFQKAYAATEGLPTNRVTATTLSASTVKAAIDAGIKSLNDLEAPKVGRIMYVSCEVYDYMKNASFFTYTLNAGEGQNNLDTRVASYEGMKVVEVPSSRFATVVTLSDTDGFTIGGKTINFLIICKGAVQVIDKITMGEVVPSANNPDSFEDTYKYLTYYDAITFDNQKTAIYAHSKA